MEKGQDPVNEIIKTVDYTNKSKSLNIPKDPRKMIKEKDGFYYLNTKDDIDIRSLNEKGQTLIQVLRNWEDLHETYEEADIYKVIAYDGSNKKQKFLYSVEEVSLAIKDGYTIVQTACFLDENKILSKKITEASEALFKNYDGSSSSSSSRSASTGSSTSASTGRSPVSSRGIEREESSYTEMKQKQAPISDGNRQIILSKLELMLGSNDGVERLLYRIYEDSNMDNNRIIEILDFFINYPSIEWALWTIQLRKYFSDKNISNELLIYLIESYMFHQIEESKRQELQIIIEEN